MVKFEAHAFADQLVHLSGFDTVGELSQKVHESRQELLLSFLICKNRAFYESVLVKILGLADIFLLEHYGVLWNLLVN